MKKRSFPLSRVYQLIEPGPVVMLTTAKKGRHNVMTMSWHTMIDFEPPLIGCVVSNRDFTFNILKATKECVIAIPTVEIADLVRKQLEAVEKNLTSLNDKYIADKIGQEAYEQTLVRYTKEKAEIQKELTKHPEKISNLDSYVNFTIDFSKSLSEKWEKSELGMKQKLQTMMFPDGIPFNKKKDDYRTCRVNTFFAAIDFISSNLAESKSGISEKQIENSALVVLRKLVSNHFRQDLMLLEVVIGIRSNRTPNYSFKNSELRFPESLIIETR